MLAPHCEFAWLVGLSWPKEAREWMENVRAAYPDAHRTVDSVHRDGDTVVAETKFFATNRGALHLSGLEIPPTGHAVTVHEAHVFHLNQGKIDRMRTYFDRAELIDQIWPPAKTANAPAPDASGETRRKPVVVSADARKHLADMRAQVLELDKQFGNQLRPLVDMPTYMAVWGNLMMPGVCGEDMAQRVQQLAEGKPAEKAEALKALSESARKCGDLREEIALFAAEMRHPGTVKN